MSPSSVSFREDMSATNQFDSAQKVDNAHTSSHDDDDESNRREGNANLSSEPTFSPPTPSSLAAKTSARKAPPTLALALFGGTVAFVSFVVARFMFRRPKINAKLLKRALFLQTLDIRLPSVKVPSTTPSPSSSTARLLLQEKSVVVSDRMDITGLKTGFGCPEWQATNMVCTVTAQIVDQLVDLGAIITATVPSCPFGLSPTRGDPAYAINSAVRNPTSPGHHHGGGDYGAAVAVAGGITDLAVAVDEMGSALVPAACCGTYAYRPTSGVLPLDGVSVASSTLGTPCILAADPALLVKAGMALRIPGGGSDASGIVSNYLIAEDLFNLCGEEMQRAAPAIISAVKRWAGTDNAQAVSLCSWLYHRFPSLTEFMPSTEGYKSKENYHGLSEDVLNALAASANAVMGWEWLHSDSGAWASAAMNRNTLPRAVRAGVEQSQRVTERQYMAGIAVAEEVSEGMRAALQEGYVFVLPTVPGPAPLHRVGIESDEFSARFRLQCQQFAALASLAGVPQVTIPLRLPGVPPLSVSLVSLQRRDFVLVKAAAKLGPMLAEAVGKIMLPAVKREEQRMQAEVGELIRDKVHAAEAAKDSGNNAFKAGRFEEAVRWYSEAIRNQPKTAIYYSNRALAYLKLGNYSAAEADCDATLALDPASVKALLRRGSARLAQGGLDEARKDFQRVLDLEPRNRQALEELARLGVSSVGNSTGLFA